MAAITISQNRNLDDATSTIAQLANGDDITIDTDALLRIDSDNRNSQQDAVIGNITISSTSGGRCLIDGREVWWVPYDGASGNIPARQAVRTIQSITGDATYATITTTAAHGYAANDIIHIKDSTVPAYDGEWTIFDAPTTTTFRVATATTTAAGPGGNVHKYDVYRSGTPVAEFLGAFNGLGVDETASGSALSTCTHLKFRRKRVTFSDNDVLDDNASGWSVTVNSSTGGQRGWLHIVTEEAMALAVPRLGEFEVQGDWFELGTSTGARDQQFQHFAADHIPAVWVETGSGTGVYEIWLNAGSRWSDAYIATDNRGKYFGCTSGGLITFAVDAAPDYGQIPPNGAKIRVPNIHGSQMASPFSAYSISATLATRFEFSTGNAGQINIHYFSAAWYFNLQQPYSVTLDHVATFHNLDISECVTPVSLDHVGTGLQSTVNTIAFTFDLSPAGGTISNSRFAKYFATGGSSALVAIDGVNDLTITACRADAFARDASTGTTFAITACQRVTMTSCVTVGGRISLGSGCRDFTFTNHACTAETVASTSTTFTYSAIVIAGGAGRITVNGWQTFDGPLVRDALLWVQAASNVTIRNIGTRAARFDLGSQSSYLAILGTGASSDNNRVQRCYVQNSRTGFFGSANLAYGWTLSNVWGDEGAGADILEMYCNDSLCRGCGAGGDQVFGQSAGDIRNNHQAVYGSHFYEQFISTTAGGIGIWFHEKTAEEPSASSYTIVAGTPKFTSTGACNMRTLNDEIIWEWPHFVKGFTEFQNASAVLGGTNTGNHSFEYKIDTGSGYNASWKTVSGANLSAETIDPGVGFRLKIRIVCTTANASNALTGFLIKMTTTSTAIDDNQYPLDVVPVTVTALDAETSDPIEGAYVYVEADTGGDLPAGDSVTITHSGTTATVTHTAHGLVSGNKVTIRGANQAPYNGLKTITKINANSYSYTMGSDPGADATGTITATAVVLAGTTNASGIATNTELEVSSDQPVTGKVRKGTAAPYYRTSPVSGTVDASVGLAVTSYLVSDE